MTVKEKGHTYMNNNNDTNHCNIQEHIINRIPASCEQEEDQKQIPVHTKIGKLDERTNIQTCYGRIRRKLDQLTYH